MGTQKPSESEFNVIQFEKRLSSLKDSQENINSCCRWCLENRQHHKKIVSSWLNVLKRVKIEQRVNLFYLANDVIQYSKRRGYDFVESWGTALQKATTLVRDEKVKHKIVRIFNIWEQRGVYNEEFISDLCGLLSAVPSSSKNDESHEFQASYVINKIKQCSKLENDTDAKLKVLKEHNPKIQIESEALMTSLKDRAHVDDVEKELDVYVKHLEGYINALKAEIKCRINNISVLKQANGHLDKDKRDVKVVANAYKTFGQRIKIFQKKLEEHKATLCSPIPSPDINAPSPSPDLDLDLPDDKDNIKHSKSSSSSSSTTTYDPTLQYNFYNPVPPPPVSTTVSNFVTNGYTSFIGTNFNMDNIGLFTNPQTSVTTEVTNSETYSSTQCTVTPLQQHDTTHSTPYQSGHLPLLPPPMPPFNPKNDYENTYNSNPTGINYDGSYPSTQPLSTDQQFPNQPIVDYELGSYDETLEATNAYGGSSLPADALDAYNPEEELENWESDANWTQPILKTNDTPESPPHFEKEGVYTETIEYHESMPVGLTADVDHRILRPLTNDIEKGKGRGKDVDHRNLISLTGSPADSNSCELWNNSEDQDYRTPNINQSTEDQDYRVVPFNIENLKLPPPPPPPPAGQIGLNKNKSPRKLQQDNVESIDMELSEDEYDRGGGGDDKRNIDKYSSLKPPPPLPDLPDDVDANCFLDNLNDEINSNEFNLNIEATTNPSFNLLPPPMPLMNPPLPVSNSTPWGHGKYRGNNNGNHRNKGNGNWGGSGGRHRSSRGGFNRGNGGGNFRGGRGGYHKGGPNRIHKHRGNFKGNFQGGY